MNELRFSDAPEKTSAVAIVVLIIAFCVGLGLWLFAAPVTYASFTFWVGAVLMAVPGYVAIETFGTFGLSGSWLHRLPRSLRIFFGVLWVLLGMFISALAVLALSVLVA